MRVLVASDRLAGLGARAASDLIGAEFAAEGAQVAVVPLSAGGPDFHDAAVTFAPEAGVLAPKDLSELVEALHTVPGAVVLDLTDTAVPSVGELAAVDTARLRAERDGSLVAVVPPDETQLPLIGLSGWVAEDGRRLERDLGETLALATTAERWAAAQELDAAEAGAGARGGLGALVRAAGGRISSGVDECARGFDVLRVMSRADVVVTGTEVLDFHRVGGDVVKRVASLAGEALRPALAVVGRNYVSARELRQVGLEAAYPVLDGFGDEAATAAGVAAVARRVAQTWRW